MVSIGRADAEAAAIRAAGHLMRSDVWIGLRVIEEVSGEYRRSQVSKRVGQLLAAPAGLLSDLPGGIGNVSRIGSRFSDQSGQRVDFGIARQSVCPEGFNLLFGQ